jgi:hypothetical protein
MLRCGDSYKCPVCQSEHLVKELEKQKPVSITIAAKNAANDLSQTTVIILVNQI